MAPVVQVSRLLGKFIISALKEDFTKTGTGAWRAMLWIFSLLERVSD
jgi:hypothetical protein